MLDQHFEMRLCLRNHWEAPVGFAHTVDDAIQFIDNMETDETYGMAFCKDGILTSVFVMEYHETETIGSANNYFDAWDGYVLRELATCKPPYDFRAVFLNDKWIASNII